MRKLLLAILLAGGCSFTIDPVGLPGAPAPSGPSSPSGPSMMMPPSMPSPMPMPSSPDLAESPDLAPPAPGGDCTVTGCPEGEVCAKGKHGEFSCMQAT